MNLNLACNFTLTLVNNSNSALTVYRGYFEDNGLGASWGWWIDSRDANSCTHSNDSYSDFIINPGANCVIYVNASSGVTDMVTFEGRLHLLSNDPNGSRITSPDITVRATPVLLTYSGSYVTARSRIDGLQFGQITLGTAGPFLVDTDTCSGQTLNDGDRCTVTVRYQPVSAGAHEAILDFANMTGGTWVALRLSGNAQDTGGSSGSDGSGGSGDSGNSGGSGGSGNTGSSGGGGGGSFSLTFGLLEGLMVLAWRRRRRHP